MRGRPPADHRRTLNAVFWIARTGAPWRDLPKELGSWNSVHRQYRRWTASGLWDLAVETLAEGGGNDAVQMVDSTVIRAHHCAAGAKRGTQNQALGRSRGGFSTKFHARTNAEGLSIALLLTPGEAHDSTAFNHLIAESDADPAVMLGDKGYDMDANQEEPSHPAHNKSSFVCDAKQN